MLAVPVAYAEEEQTGSVVISKTVAGNAASGDAEFPFTIKAWQGEQTAYKKIADLTGTLSIAEFWGTVSVQGYITDYDEDYYIQPGDTGAYLDVDVGPIDNTGLLYLSRMLNVNEILAVPDPYIYNMTIDGESYPVHIWLDSWFRQDNDTDAYPIHVFGFYIEDNEENAGIDTFSASSTGRTSRTIGDVTYVDFSKQGLQSAADPNTYTFNLKSGENIELQIPDGYTYEITEVTTDGWELDSVETSGGAAADGAVVSGTMDENTPATVSFTNVKKVDTTDDPKGEDPEDPKDDDPKSDDPENPKDDEPKGGDPEDPKDDEPKDSEPTEPTDPKPPVTPEPEDPAPQDPTPVDPTPGSEDPEPSKPQDPVPPKDGAPTKAAPGKTTPANTTPQTGDTTNPALWLALLALSGVGLAGTYRLRRREER